MKQSIQAKLFIPITSGFIVVILLIAVCMVYIKRQNSEHAGIKAARYITYQIQNLRELYSKTIIPRIERAGMQAHFDFTDHLDRLPTPETLVDVLSKELQKEYPGSSLRLYSRHPFSHHAKTKHNDAFGAAALDALEAAPHVPFYRLEDLDGRLSIRYAVSDIMKESCVGCHNTHPQSPKTDWEVGDIHGVLEVVIPVDDMTMAFESSMATLFGIIGISLLSVALMIVMICRYVLVNPVKELAITSERIKEGDLQARILIRSQDEIGVMAAGLNSLLDRLVTLVEKTEAERDSMQGSIMKLLSEVSDVAQGDLTVEAEVSEDMTGAIADSFNHMIYELRRIVTNVHEATWQVSSSASEIRTNTEYLAEGSGAQAAQIVDSAAALDEMTVSIQQVSENASLSATVAEQALANAKQGTIAVQNTVRAMHRIRDQIQETSLHIQELGKHSKEISEIVQLIADIADRTGVLALNASIEAALAGEAGQGFATVAREVERLAEGATEATKQIHELVDTIQVETKEAVSAMEQSTREVAQGSHVADQAGGALREIESVSTRLADLIQSISLAATQQARGSENLSKAMSEISEVTQHTANETRQAAMSINKLAVLADELRNSVSTFKLPPVLPVQHRRTAAHV